MKNQIIDKKKSINRYYLLMMLLGLNCICFAQNTQKPNIIIILADDLGFSDIGCYGSEIKTPNLDLLAANGAKFTQFYNNARCCPSRASLLTGVYPHQAGIGDMVEKKAIKNRIPETPYQGWLSKNTVTIAEVLKTAGYQTYISGKWHVGEERQDWPLQRGFDNFFGLVNGTSSYYELLPTPNHLILENNEPYIIPENFYMTDAISDKAVGYIDLNKTTNKPFFMYVAYTAPHYPLHAPAEEIAKYKRKYLKGWDILRKERFEKQQKIGLLPKNILLSVREASVPSWESVTNKEEWDMKMATYAAMITRMDAGIGKIVAKLKATGKLENTIIFFMADNGASAEEISGRVKTDVGSENYDATLTKTIGAKGSYVGLDKPWAIMGNTPFRFYKIFTHEGGISSPLIVSYPKMIKKGFQTNQIVQIMDIMPTCLDLSGATYPTTFNTHSIKPIEGLSLLPIIMGKTRKPQDFLAWEHQDSRAIRQGNWKIVWAKTIKKWELYDLENDRIESNDLSLKFPEQLNQMITIYEKWALKVGVKTIVKN